MERAESAVLTVGRPLPIVADNQYEMVEGMGAERRADCGHYGNCLDYAVRKGWEDFSCQGCLDYVNDGPGLRRSADGIRASMIRARQD